MLDMADFVLVSWAKSGRTWLRALLGRFYELKHGFSDAALLDFDNLHRKDADIPSVFFTHGNYLTDYTKNGDSKADFYDKNVLLLVRDPRDVAVSQYFNWKFRMSPWKKKLNGFPRHEAEVSLFDFLMLPECGLPRIVEFLNSWAAELPRLRSKLLVRYEDMRSDTPAVLAEILEFLGTPGTAAQVSGAVEFASFENLKRLEDERVFSSHGGRLVPTDRGNPDSYKVRRGKVGGYRDYLDDDQLAMVDGFTSSTLNPSYGYMREYASPTPGTQE